MEYLSSRIRDKKEYRNFQVLWDVVVKQFGIEKPVLFVLVR